MSYMVGRADRLLRAHMDKVLAEEDLTVPELTALSVLAVRPGLSNARLARRSLVTPQAMHKVLRSLEDRNLIERAPSEAGGRAMDAFITEAGHNVLQQFEGPLDVVEDTFLADLDPEERAEFARLLRVVCRFDDGRPPTADAE